MHLNISSIWPHGDVGFGNFRKESLEYPKSNSTRECSKSPAPLGHSPKNQDQMSALSSSNQNEDGAAKKAPWFELGLWAKGSEVYRLRGMGVELFVQIYALSRPFALGFWSLQKPSVNEISRSQYDITYKHESCTVSLRS